MITQDEYNQANELDRKHWLYTFAGQAMQGLLSNYAGVNWAMREVAMESVEFAEALLAELEKDNNENP